MKRQPATSGWNAGLAVLVGAWLLAGCAAPLADRAALEPDVVFTLQAQGGDAIVRALTRNPSCPVIEWEGGTREVMTARAAPATIAARASAAQADRKPARFEVLTCEASWPRGIAGARIDGRGVPAPRREIRRIAIIADTGCRMKGSENAFQDCNDPAGWPFATVAASAAALRPDLVLHIGDIHYRESPCPAGKAGCAGSPWGYGDDAWQADFFGPARPLLAQAPWVFVRGNHESCARAGQGWFRFLDAQPWRESRSCDTPALDGDADYSQPYAVPVTADTQLVVFDSAATSGKPLQASDPAFSKYHEQMLAVAALAGRMPHNFFLSHHPLLAIAPGRSGAAARPGGNGGLQSVFADLYPQRLFPPSVDLAIHGHIHLFEAIGFSSAHPVSLVLGNSGSANEGAAPSPLPAGVQPYPGAVVEDYAARAEYGFAMLEWQEGGAWLLTEYSAGGEPVLRCRIRDGKSSCAAL